MLKLAGECIEGQMADHIARLDAHTYNLLQKFRTGEYIETLLGTTAAANALTANKLYAVPFVVARAMTFDRIAVQVTTLAAGSSIRLGIYNDGTNLYPGALLLDAGEVSAATTGVKAITINQALTKGLYWLALVSDGAPAIYFSYWGWAGLGKVATNFSDEQYRYWSVSFTYAALPDPFTTGGSRTSANAKPGIFMRLASLDEGG